MIHRFKKIRPNLLRKETYVGSVKAAAIVLKAWVQKNGFRLKNELGEFGKTCTSCRILYSTMGALCSKSELCVPAQPISDPISQDVRDTLRASFPSVEIFFFGSLQCVIWYTEAGHCDNKVQLYPTDFESNRGGRIYQWWCPRMGVAWQAPWVLSCWHCTPNSSADVAGILKLANKHNVSVCYDFDNRRPSQILFWGLGWIKLDWLMLLLFYYFIRK